MPGRRHPLTLVLAIVVVGAVACSQGDGRDLAEPDPDLIRPPTTTAPTAAGSEARGGAAPGFALPVQITGVRGLMLRSPAFEPGEELPGAFTCEGAGRPPPLRWEGVSADAAELALVVRDADGGGRVHWLVTDLSPDVDRIGGDDGAVPEGAGVRRNELGVFGWSPPCPPAGAHHRFVFVLYERSTPLDVTGAAPLDVIAALESEGDAAATLVATVTPPES